MARRAECYVDTSALIAFLDRSDSHQALFRRLFSDPPPLVTSALVVAEGHGWFLRRYDRRRAVQFLSFIDELAPLSVQAFNREELCKAASLIKKFGDLKRKKKTWPRARTAPLPARWRAPLPDGRGSATPPSRAREQAAWVIRSPLFGCYA